MLRATVNVRTRLRLLPDIAASHVGWINSSVAAMGEGFERKFADETSHVAAQPNRRTPHFLGTTSKPTTTMIVAKVKSP